jgi:hypothetical protein
MKRTPLALLGLLLVALPAYAQIVPKDAAEPIEIHKARGAFAQKLNGGVMPTGKSWKAVMDPARRLQLMFPEKWKVTTTDQAESVIIANPADAPKEGGPVLTVSLLAPRDADPFDIDETFALNYADSLAEDPQFKRLHYEPTDSGHVLMRGLKFALAGGKVSIDGRAPSKKKGEKGEKISQSYQQEQLIYIATDRLVVIQFSAPSDTFSRYADDLAKIFASYQNIGIIKVD